MNIGRGVAVGRQDAILLVKFGDVEDGAAAIPSRVSAGVLSALLGEVEEPGAAGGVDDDIGVAAYSLIGILGAGFAEKVLRLLLPRSQIVRTEDSQTCMGIVDQPIGAVPLEYDRTLPVVGGRDAFVGPVNQVGESLK